MWENVRQSMKTHLGDAEEARLKSFGSSSPQSFRDNASLELGWVLSPRRVYVDDMTSYANTLKRLLMALINVGAIHDEESISLNEWLKELSDNAVLLGERNIEEHNHVWPWTHHA